VNVIALPSAKATQALAASLGSRLFGGATLLLQGELGAGKTTFVQGLAQGLGIPDAITSPTFNLIHEYDQGSLPLIHIDLYRLMPEEVPALGLEEYWQRQDAVVAIEWPQRLVELPPEWLWITLVMVSEQERELQWQSVGSRHQALLPRAWAADS